MSKRLLVINLQGFRVYSHNGQSEQCTAPPHIDTGGDRDPQQRGLGSVVIVSSSLSPWAETSGGAVAGVSTLGYERY